MWDMGFCGGEITLTSPRTLSMGNDVGGTGKELGVGRGARFGDHFTSELHLEWAP